MKKLLFVLAFVLISGLILFPVEGRAQMGPGRMGPEGGYGAWNYCPYCGAPMGPEMTGPGYGRGYGMMGPGYGMGPGMMGPGYGRGPGMMGPGYGSPYGQPYGPPYQQQREPMKEKDAQQIVENYLRATRNPNLKLGKIIDKDTYFEAEILTKEDSLADKVAVDKRTGWMQSIY
ncbi:MAG: hypothetical protein JSV55_11670 [Deltaproteobacteria bacterium]|nr:MAG: hypothetical protein JSV55_11670 [Deltaproteobacteria bacterium]